MALIELKNITKRFGRLLVLNNLTLSIETGKCLTVIGASGTGKSVLLKHIVVLLRPDRGEVWFEGKRIDDLPERDLVSVRTRFGFLFQMGALFDSLTVAENIGFPLVEHTHKPPDEIKRIVEQKLRQVGLPEAGTKMPGELSGGQRKRGMSYELVAQPATRLPAVVCTMPDGTKVGGSFKLSSGHVAEVTAMIVPPK